MRRGRALPLGRLLVAIVLGSVSDGAETAAQPVKAIVDQDRAVVACVVDNVVKNARDCPLGAVTIFDTIPVKAGIFEVTGYARKIAVGLARGDENLSLQQCSVIVAEASSGRVQPTGSSVTVTIRELDRSDGTLRSSIDSALSMREVRIQKAYALSVEAEEPHVFFIASNLDEAIAYSQKDWPHGDPITYYILAGFLHKNRDGRDRVEMTYSAFDTALTDAGPFFDLLAVAVYNQTLMIVISRGIALSPTTYAIDLWSGRSFEQPKRCQ